MHAAIAAVAVTLLLPAHASVIDSTPQDGSTLTEQPTSLSVVLNEAIIDVPGAEGGNVMQLTDAAGLHYGDGCATVDGDTLSLAAELGAPGDYTLAYQVVSADGHAVSGEIGFAFDPADGEAGAAGAEAAPVCGAAAPVASESAPTEPSPAEATATAGAAPEATASSNQGAPIESDAPAEGDGGQLPLLALGVLAVLAVLTLIAYRANRLRKGRGDA